MVAICGEESFYILKYNADAVTNATSEEITEDGIEEAFEVIGEGFYFSETRNLEGGGKDNSLG